ncbi:MAG TPA: hypothetical protein VKM72_30565 [Thermoanaerobaculia bacterium]|nr:hypothetical protein [Thermoanaerobaculia bacterium]
MASPEPPVAPSTNAFRSAYLDLLHRQDEAFFSAEGENAGPWNLRAEEGGYALYRQWEGREHGDVPEAVFQYRDLALLFLAVWPAVGRDPVFRAGERAEDGHEVLGGAAVVGHLRSFSDELLQAAHVAAAIARAPLALAALVEAAGPVVQEKVGQILGRRMTERPG